MSIEKRNKNQWACIQGTWDSDGEKSPTQEYHCCVLWAAPGNLVTLNHLQWTLFYWLNHKDLKSPGWSLLCKTEKSSHFMAPYPDRILCSLYFVLCISSSKDWTGLLCAWHVKKRNLETMHWTASSMGCTEALRENQGFASQLQMCGCKSVPGSWKSEFSFFPCNERARVYGGWNGALECGQNKASLRTRSRNLPSSAAAKLLEGKNWELSLQLRVTESEQRAQLFTPDPVSQRGGSHPWVEKWHTRIVPIEPF